MPKAILQIANGFYMSDSLPISAQECTNFYPNKITAVPALSTETLFGTAGSTQLATSGVILQQNRGSHTMAGIAYFVNGNAIYRLSADNTLSNLGEISGSGRVSMADNGTQLLILVPGGEGFILTDDPPVLTKITDADFTANGNPQYVVFIDGYFALTTDSKKFIVSAINNGLSYNALDFGTAEADPDKIVAPVVFNNQLFIAGSETTEAFQNQGGTGFPFQRSGLFMAKGVKAPFSIVNSSDTFMFIGGGENESPAIWAYQGNSYIKVSTTAIDSILSSTSEADVVSAFAWSYAQDGAYFVGFSLPNTTLVFDTISAKWHERKSNVNGDTIRSRINSVTSAYGLILVGDSQDGRIGNLSTEVYTEYGNNIVRRVATQPFQNNMESFTVPSLELTMEAGVGNEAVVNPQIMMDRSTDGGKTFVDQRTRSIGKIGQYNKRTIWRRNGRAARFEVFRFTLSDAVKPVIIQLTADMMQ